MRNRSGVEGPIAGPTIRRWVKGRARAGFQAGARVRRRLPDPGTSVALTFDDGPDPTWTARVLDVLAELEVPATFFVLGGKASERPALIRRMLDQGCAVGSHSTTHPEPDELSLRELIAEYAGGAAAVERIVGVPNRRFRPPKGVVGHHGMLAIRAARLRPWLWTVDPNDWRPTTTADDIVERCEGAVPGDIILLHDGIEAPVAPEAADRSATLDALPRLVASLRTRGLTFAALP